MPAVRRTKQDPNEAAGLLATTAIMSETIPPCVNMIVFGFVANVSIGGLFAAGLIPAGVLAVVLIAVAIYFGKRINPDEAFEHRKPLIPLIVGGLVGLIMIFMIGRGVIFGVATSTEVSAFAVVYALVVGGLAFRELTVKSTIKLFVDSAATTGTILFIVAAASSLSFSLAIEQIPQNLAISLISFGTQYGAIMFLIASSIMMIVFGSILEGAPALIIFGPLLTPIAVQLGVDPLHFGILSVVALGFGICSPPLGICLYTTCAVTGTNIKDVSRPMMKYLLVLLLGLVLLILVPEFSLWLPRRWGF
jgi:tripartite ATP-independent transporter DctM subunit